MDSYFELPIGDCAPDIVTATVEIPQDSEGQPTKVLGWKDRDSAHEVIRSSQNRFNEK